jgi:membrane protein insertase Oxa1/YidC/SpoIIIJ
MSYLVECVAGPSRHAGHAFRQLRTPLTPSSITRPRVSRPLRARIALDLPAKRFQSTSAASPVVFDTVSTAAETSILDPLANLLLASPLPAWVTIIALTLCVRTGITLPVTLWQRRRMLREAQEVRPRMKEINEKLAVVVARESREKGLGYEEYKKNLKARVRGWVVGRWKLDMD